MKISAIVITKNEEDTIYDCLKSISWVDEIIIYDQNSNDRTIEISKNFNVKIIVDEKWEGFGIQKNKALKHASGIWILSIDADERISKTLRDSIQNAVKENKKDVFMFSRLSKYCGRYMKYSGWQPDYVTRFFRNGKAKFSDDLVHEKLLFDGEIGKLKGKLLHESFRSTEQVIEKINHYSTLGALKLNKQGRHSSLGIALFRSFFSKIVSSIVTL